MLQHNQLQLHDRNITVSHKLANSFLFLKAMNFSVNLINTDNPDRYLHHKPMSVNIYL